MIDEELVNDLRAPLQRQRGLNLLGFALMRVRESLGRIQ